MTEDQRNSEHHVCSVDGQPSSQDHFSIGHRVPYVEGNPLSLKRQSDEGLRGYDTHLRVADIGLIQELHRDRQALVRSNTALTLQIKSVCRRLVGGDKAEAERLYRAMAGKGEHVHSHGAAIRCAPFFDAVEVIAKSRAEREKAMLKLAKALPAYGFVNTAPGFGGASFAAVIGECGDLSNYSGPAKVWKRMGLAVIDGRAQRRVTGLDAKEHGFNPARRSIMWNIGSCIIKTGRGRYREAYDARKAYEVERNPEIKKIAAHARAQRYAEKLLLKDLWRFWRDVTACSRLHPSQSSSQDQPNHSDQTDLAQLTSPG